MRVLHAATLVAAALLAGSVVSGQSLGEAAAREREKRKGKPTPGKVFTESDLRSAGGVVSAPAAGDAGAAPAAEGLPKGADAGAAGGAGAAAKEKTPEELRAEQEQEWRQRVEAANKDVAAYRERIDQIQLDLNDISGGLYSPRRAGLQTRLEEAQKSLASAEQKLADLQEEGRRNLFR